MTLYVVGIGDGHGTLTADGRDALERCGTVTGYGRYIDLIAGDHPDKEYIRSGMRQERQRCIESLILAEDRDTALICSGDAEVYAMASLVLEMAPGHPSVQVRIIPGVSAAYSGGALLGSPLTCDHALISLSDLLTPWEKIEKRLRCAAEADMAIVLYNPCSKGRPEHLKNAVDILSEHLPPETVCGYAKNIGRPDESYEVMTLDRLRDIPADMSTTVFIGCSATKEIGGRMVTLRGYE